MNNIQMTLSERSESKSITLLKKIGEQIEQSIENEHNQQGKKRIHRKSDISNFIMKTYRILEDKRIAHIIEWTDNGQSFIVRNKEQFQSEILPRYFKHSKFSSFVRQLNMYDFHKIRKQKQIPIFQHKYFKMGCHDLLHKIKRKSGEEPREDDDIIPSYPSIVNTAYHISTMPLSAKSRCLSDELEFLNQSNNELRFSIADLSKKIALHEVTRSKQKEKLMKIMSAIIYFDMNCSNSEDDFSFRDLAQHFFMDEEPLSLNEYTIELSRLYKIVKKNLIR